MRCFRAIASLAIFLSLGIGARTQGAADSLHHLLILHPGQDTHRVRLLTEYAWVLREGSLDLREQALEEALQLARILHDDRGIADALMQLGNCRQTKGDFGTAQQFFIESIRIRQQLGDVGGVANGYNNLGKVQRLQGRLLESERSLMAALRQYQNLRDTAEIAVAYNQLCRLYREMGDYRRSLEFGYAGLGLRKSQRTYAPAEIGKSYNAIGGVLEAMGQNHRALQAYDSARLKYQEAGNQRELAAVLSNLAIVAEYEGAYDSALAMSKESFHQFMVLGDSLRGATILRNMARIYTAQGQFDRARAVLKDAQDILRGTDLRDLQLLVLADQAEIDLWDGKPKAALMGLEQLLGRQDSLKETAQRIHLMQMASIALAANQRWQESYKQYFAAYRLRDQMDQQEHGTLYLYDQYLEAEKTRLLYQERLKLALEQQYSQRVIYVSVIIGLALVLLLSLQALRHTRKLKEAERIRFELESRAQSVDLLVQTQELQAIRSAIEAADRERDRIAHDMHDSAGARITQIGFTLSRLRDQVASAFPNALEIVDELARDLEGMSREIRAVTHDLRSPTLHQFGLVAALEGMRDAIMQSGKLKFELDSYGFDDRLDFAIENALHLIVKELMNNAIRHGRATEFSVQVIREEATVQMMVEDNGIGFDSSDQKMRRGNGLQGIEKRVMALGGVLNIDSQPGRGSIFSITLPTD